MLEYGKNRRRVRREWKRREREENDKKSINVTDNKEK
jgi:hypothetical protein